MSYILEALKKAEQQRELGGVPGLGSMHEQPQGTGHRRWLWLIASVLMLNLVVLLALLWPRAGPQGRLDAATEAVSPARATPPQSLAPRPPAAPEPPVRTSQPDAASSLAVATKPAAKAPPEPRPEAPVAAPLVPIETETPPAPAGSRRDDAPRLPVWPQIPAYLFEQLKGNLRLDVHVFAGQPAERFVLINLKKYQQGQQLQEGPRLDEITADGVILSFRGERFRLQAQQ